MDETGRAADPQWRQLIRLGEQITSQPTPGAQCEQIVTSVSQLIAGTVRVWLASPAYPIPGQFPPNSSQEYEFLPAAEATPLAHQAFEERRPCCQPIKASAKRSQPTRERFAAIAIPLIANENMLGVVQIDQLGKKAFTERDLSQVEALVTHAAGAMEIARQETLKNWRFEQINLVRAVSAQIVSIRDPNELFAKVANLIQATFGYYYVAIFISDARLERFTFRANAANQNAVVTLPADFSVRPGEGIIGSVALTGEEIVAAQVEQDPRYRHIDALPDTTSEAAFPIKVDNRVLGVLDVQSNQPDTLHDIDLLVLRTLADNIALAMESAQLYDRLHRRAEHISSVFEVSNALASLLDMDELLDEVVRLIQRRFGFPFVHVFSVHPGRRRVIYQAGSGERSEAMHTADLSYPLDSPEGIIPWVARNGKTLMVNDVSQEPLYVASELPPLDTRSELTIPLMAGTEVLGILDIQSDQVNAFDENDRSLFETLAVTIASAMRNASVHRSEQWRRRVAESFRDVADLITTNHPLNQLLDTILEKLETNLPCDAAAIWLLDDDNGEDVPLRLAAAHRIEPELIIAAQQQDDARSMLTRTLEAAQPIIRGVDDPYGPLGAALGFERDYSSIAAPLRTDDRPVGLIALAHHQNGRFGSEALAMVATFASYAAVAIRNARLFQEAQEQALISTMLQQVAEASQTTATVDDLLNTMVRLARLLMGVRKCAFLLWEESVQVYELKVWYGFDPPGEAPYLFSPHLPAFNRLAAERSAFHLDQPADELDLPELSLEPELGTVMMLPLLMRGELGGAFLVTLQLGAQPDAERGFDLKALSILQGIAHQTAISVDNLRLLEARQEEAYVTAALLQVAQAVVSSNDLHDTLDTIVHLLPILVGIDACVIYLWDPTNRLFRPSQVYASSRKEEEALISHPYAPGEHQQLDLVLQHGELYLCQIHDHHLASTEWGTLPPMPFSQLSEQGSPPVGDWLLAYPLSLQGVVLGVMLVREKNTSPSFWEKRLEIINGIAQQVSLAIQNDIMQQEMVENERRDREVQLARQIQETFLPDSLPVLDDWELDLRWETAREVGGDFYDIFRLDNNRLGLVIADVSDKGLPAALYMTVARTLIRANAGNDDSPARVLEKVNNLLVNDSADSMFITVVYAILQLESGQLTYANAGHNRPLLYRVALRQVEQLPKGGMALGILTDNALEDHTVFIGTGDTLTLFTDGVTDILSPQGESFGEERLRQLIAEHGEHNVETLLENVDDALTDFRHGARQFDDVTLVALRRTD